MATHGLPTWPWTDQEAETLPLAEAVLLEAVRRWAEAARRGRPGLPELRLPLIAEGAGAAAGPLDAALRLMPAGLVIGGVLESRLRGDEPALLLAFALAQRAPRREAVAALLRLMPPGPACAAILPAAALGLAFRRGGLLLRRPLR